MSHQNQPINKCRKRNLAQMNEMLMVFGFLAAWIALQAWILPRFGIDT